MLIMLNKKKLRGSGGAIVVGIDDKYQNTAIHQSYQVETWQPISVALSKAILNLLRIKGA